jgi:hypothetical protein
MSSSDWSGSSPKLRAALERTRQQVLDAERLVEVARRAGSPNAAEMEEQLRQLRDRLGMGQRPGDPASA